MVDKFRSDRVILSSHKSDFDTTENASELCRFFYIPSFRESIEKSSSEGIATSSGINYSLYRDPWNHYFSHFSFYNCSFISESDDTCPSICMAYLGKILTNYTLELDSFWFIHNGDRRFQNTGNELFSRKYPHCLSRVKNSKNSCIGAFLYSSNHSLFRIRRDDRVLESDISVCDLSRSTHRPWMERIYLTISLISKDIRLRAITSRNDHYEFSIDSHFL